MKKYQNAFAAGQGTINIMDGILVSGMGIWGLWSPNMAIPAIITFATCNIIIGIVRIILYW